MIDYENVLFGTEEGLYAGNLQRDEFVKITDKRVNEIGLIKELDLIIIISGIKIISFLVFCEQSSFEPNWSLICVERRLWRWLTLVLQLRTT